MTDEQLLQLLKERPNYKAPILFDEELAQLISKRGCENTFLKKKSLQRTTGIAILIGAMVGLFTGLANLPFAPVATIALLIYMFFGVGVGVYLAARVANSFKNHQYDATHQRLANAIWWNSNWYPFTCYPLIRCQNIELTMLMREGRTLELEVYSQFCFLQLR